ncbi:MAG: glycosyltransferase family 2 protein [Flavobacteriaceae bacterium]|nr:glycosyltransferase family 2 protein [Flavobacteriaceae bacterium]
MKISAVIITYNEEKNISTCLDSLKSIADEILVIDSYSTDKTEQICSKYDLKFVKNKFEGHIQQKNYGVSLASYNYILSIDADEVMSSELIKSVLKIKKESNPGKAYNYNRLNKYCGKWIKYGGWYPDAKIRIWNKDHGQWGGENPHDTVILKGDEKVKKLKGDLLHYSVIDLESRMNTMNNFTSISAEEKYKKGVKVSIFGALMRAMFRFFKTYIIKLGFMDGKIGLIIAINTSYYVFIKYSKLWFMNNEVNKENKK